MRSASRRQIFQPCNSISAFQLCVHSKSTAKLKINSNLNYWKKEHQESEIKMALFSEILLIGKLFLQGILMVLREDCKIKLIGWGRLIANAFLAVQLPPVFMTSPSYLEGLKILNHLIHARTFSQSSKTILRLEPWQNFLFSAFPIRLTLLTNITKRFVFFLSFLCLFFFFFNIPDEDASLTMKWWVMEIKDT